MKKSTIYLLISIILLFLIAGLTTAFFLLPSGEVNKLSLAKNELLKPMDIKIVTASQAKNILVSSTQIFAPTIPVVKLLFVGDIMLDRNVFGKTKLAGDYNYPFSLISWPEKFDFRIANLEGPITDNKSIVSARNLAFTFSPLFIEALKNNFEIVDLANNHTNNFGDKGLKTTHEYLDKNNIGYFGDPYNQADKMVKIIEKDGIKIGLVGFNQLAKQGFEDFLQAVSSTASTTDLVIAFPHWGIEYSTKNPGEVQKRQARQIIDAGANLIIGTHPHVVQPIEEYNGKLIFYSLGNFIFDQYFSPETMTGLAVGLELVKISGEIKENFKLYPITIDDESRAQLTDAVGKEKLLNFLANYSSPTSTLAEQILGAEIKY